MGGMQGMGGGMGGMMGGGGMGGMMGGGGMGGMGMGGMGGMMNIPAEKTTKFKVPLVCLEHGKLDPRPSARTRSSRSIASRKTLRSSSSARCWAKAN